MYCLSRLTEGPQNISPPFITLNILLGNFFFLFVCPVCQASLGEYDATAMPLSLFCVMVDRNHVFKLAKENDKVLIYGPEPGTLIISLGIF